MMACTQHQARTDSSSRSQNQSCSPSNLMSSWISPLVQRLPMCTCRPILKRRNLCILSAVATGPGGDSDDLSDLERTRQQLSRVYETPSISGQELRELIVEKWGRSYDTRLHKRGRRVYLQIMWKFLEQRSFHMNELEYQAQLDAVAEYLTLWRVGPTVRAAIRSAPPRGPGYTGGGGARAVSIPLDVELDGARSGEWDSF